MDIREEKMNEYFTKYYLGGLPFDAVIHQFVNAKDEHFHNHPFSFTTHILKGSYVELVYENNHFQAVHRKAGTAHYVAADCIHKIIDLPEGECWTLILPEPKVQEPGFYKFDGGELYFRYWHEPEFRLLE